MRALTVLAWRQCGQGLREDCQDALSLDDGLALYRMDVVEDEPHDYRGDIEQGNKQGQSAHNGHRVFALI